ncbi:MAG: CHAP domain-containing protein [Ligilactobacillus acidipiscis]|jgi:peptidoglycan hydrolase CwlO-like protein|nr:CHAP domain-containing protein [Ligilactobacillus acidipiscis]
MKKNLLSQCAIVLATVTTMSVVAPAVSADTASDLNDVNTEIAATKKKIADSQKKIDAATELQMKKSQKINDLKDQISKRDGQLKKQAQSAQINNSGSMLKFVTDSDSISDAFGRTVTVARVVNANNQTMEQQKNDQEQVEKEQAALTKSVKDEEKSKMSLYRDMASLNAKEAKLAAQNDKENAAKQEAAEKAAQAEKAAKKAKNTQDASLAADKANAAAHSDTNKDNQQKQQASVDNGSNAGNQTAQAAMQQVSTVSHGNGGGANGYPYGECTYFVKVHAPWVGGHWGNGQEWAGSAAAAGFRVDHSPSVGSVVVFPGGSNVGGWIAAPGYGHVAIVTAVNGNSFSIIQGGNGFSNPMGGNPQTVTLGSGMSFIHQ